MRKHLIYLLLCIIPYLGLAQTDTAVGFSVKFTVEQYIEKYSAIAVDEMYRSKIPASITLAQGILEVEMETAD